MKWREPFARDVYCLAIDEMLLSTPRVLHAGHSLWAGFSPKLITQKNRKVASYGSRPASVVGMGTMTLRLSYRYWIRVHVCMRSCCMVAFDFFLDLSLTYCLSSFTTLEFSVSQCAERTSAHWMLAYVHHEQRRFRLVLQPGSAVPVSHYSGGDGTTWTEMSHSERATTIDSSLYDTTYSLHSAGVALIKSTSGAYS